MNGWCAGFCGAAANADGGALSGPTKSFGLWICIDYAVLCATPRKPHPEDHL